MLEAAGDELLEVGFERLSLASVARRAGVHHTTIYRRWGKKERLVVDALLELTRERVSAPDFGDVRSDLRSYFQALVEAFGDPRAEALMRSLVALPAEEFA
ncbi:MAG: TetR/AcrR family transcriptional regulator, partial [Solirubrobacteraceae bacterium]